MSVSPTSAPQPASAPVPKKIGPYQVVGVLGKGGMAELFLARRFGPQGFARSVAIKRILPHLSEDPGFVTMFLDEARIAAGIQHPNVVSVEELNNDDDGLYMVMEYLAGESLAALMHQLTITKQTLDPEIAAHIMAQACAGLHAAHTLKGNAGEELAIVHRDISPQNLLITYDGTVKVLDFGIAHAANRLTKTESGSLKGKLSYLSPEQLQNADLDQRSDVFALGIVLHELLTLKRLFKGDNPGATLRAVLHKQVPPPSEGRADVPEELDAICLKALARAFHERYEWASDMRRDLLRLPRRDHDELPEERLRDLMHGLFGDRAAAKRDMLRKVREGGSISVVVGGEALSLAEPGTAAAEGASAIRTKSGGTSRPVWLLGAALLLGALIGAALWMSSNSADPAAASPAAPEARPTVVHVTISSTPPGAAVTGVGDAVLTTPGVLDVPRGDGPLVLRFELDGHEAWSEEITPNLDQRIRVTLTPLRDPGEGEATDPASTADPQEPTEPAEASPDPAPRPRSRGREKQPRMQRRTPAMENRFQIWE